MQLHALNSEDNIIAAINASKEETYRCLECKTELGVRKGDVRQPHFFHLNPHRECRQNNKTEPHIRTQQYLLEQLPKGECALEYRFEGICRIADVVWFPQKIVFEVQCSPISKEEVASRNQDYKSIGYDVVWILHERRFHRRRISSIETFLKDSPKFYTNMDKQGRGFVYDQLFSIENGWKRNKGPILPVSIPNIFPWDSNIPNKFIDRQKNFPFYFQNDRIDFSLKHPEVLLEKKKRGEKFFQKIFRLYLLVFRTLLEKCCI